MSKSGNIFTAISFERNKTKHYITNPNPDKWLRFPYFPLTRKTEQGKELGMVFAAGKQTIVYLQNIYLIPPNMSIKQFMEETEKIEYENIEELLDDGWLGD